MSAQQVAVLSFVNACNLLTRITTDRGIITTPVGVVVLVDGIIVATNAVRSERTRPDKLPSGFVLVRACVCTYWYTRGLRRRHSRGESSTDNSSENKQAHDEGASGIRGNSLERLARLTPLYIMRFLDFDQLQPGVTAAPSPSP
jgi:hypothetical protein